MEVNIDDKQAEIYAGADIESPFELELRRTRQGITVIEREERVSWSWVWNVMEGSVAGAGVLMALSSNMSATTAGAAMLGEDTSAAFEVSKWGTIPFLFAGWAAGAFLLSCELDRPDHPTFTGFCSKYAFVAAVFSAVAVGSNALAYQLSTIDNIGHAALAKSTSLGFFSASLLAAPFIYLADRGCRLAAVSDDVSALRNSCSSCFIT